jgi:hypothetical protein
MPRPTPRVAEVIVDAELDREGFRYRLNSGEEGCVHIDAVLGDNEDLSHMADLTRYRLTQEAKSRYEASGLRLEKYPVGLEHPRHSSIAFWTRPTNPSPYAT